MFKRCFLVVFLLCCCVSARADDVYIDPSDPENYLNSIAQEVYTIQNLLIDFTFTRVPAIIEAINNVTNNNPNVVVNIPPVDLTLLEQNTTFSLQYLDVILNQVLAANGLVQNGNATLVDIYTILDRGGLVNFSTSTSTLISQFELLLNRFDLLNSSLGFSPSITLNASLTELKEQTQVFYESVAYFYDFARMYLQALLENSFDIISQLENLNNTVSDWRLTYYLDGILSLLNSQIFITSSIDNYFQNGFTSLLSPFYGDYNYRQFVPMGRSPLLWSSVNSLTEDTSCSSPFQLTTGNWFDDVLISIDNVTKYQEHIIKGGILNVVYQKAISNELAVQTIEMTNRFERVQSTLDDILHHLTNQNAEVENQYNSLAADVTSGISAAESEVFHDENHLTADTGQAIIVKGRGVLSALSVNTMPDYIYWVGIDFDSKGNLVSAPICADLREYSRAFSLIRSLFTFFIWSGIVLFVICTWRLIARAWTLLVTCAYGTDSGS